MMRKSARGPLALASFLAAAALYAGDALPDFVRFEKNGGFSVDEDLTAFVQYYDADWRASSQGALKTSQGFPVAKDGSFETEGLLDVNGSEAPLKVSEKVEATKPGAFDYRADMEGEAVAKAKEICLALRVQTGKGDFAIIVDGAVIEIPKRVEKNKTIASLRGSSLQVFLPKRELRIDGDFNLVAMDERDLPRACVTLRVRPVKQGSSKRLWSLPLKFAFSRSIGEHMRIPLAAACDMGFKDEKADDGKGGWTDQGPNNDLRALKPGVLKTHGVEFEIIDPASNGGKSCVVIATWEGKFPKNASVELKPTGKSFRYLYLLHANAWLRTDNPKGIGWIDVDFADGTKSRIPVQLGRDSGNWWMPCEYFSNALLAWSGRAGKTPIGLYLSCFPLGGEPRRISFEAGPSARTWMIVAASLGDKATRNEVEENAVRISAGGKWTPIEFDGRTLAGSPLDFSAGVDAPAGKYGPVRISREGRFFFEKRPDARVRFYGTNLVGSSNVPSKELADDFVEKITRLGHNSVRLHHFENAIIKRGAKDSLTFDKDALDRFDYLFAELKKRGVYVCIDLYASRLLKPGDGIAEMDDFYRYEMKSLAHVSPTALANWKEFARRVLTRKNPYTGMTLAEDPGLYSLNLINENVLLSDWLAYPALLPIYARKYSEWLEERGLDSPENLRSRGGLFAEFLVDLQDRTTKEQMRFLRDEIKLSALITNLNHMSKYSMAGLRSQLDFVDNHKYWDHPRFQGKKWNMPFFFENKASIEENALVPRGMMPTRVFGKPFTVTEFNFCVPNVFRVECAPLIGGYAGLQDWDGLYRFAWSHGLDKMKKTLVPSGFDEVSDPQAQLADRIINALFVRGDVEAAKEAFAFEFDPASIRRLSGTTSDGEYPEEFSALGLYARIGTLMKGTSFPGVKNCDPLAAGWTKALPADAVKALDSLTRSGKIVSSTGELTLDSKNVSMKVVTPRSEVFTFKGKMAGTVMSAEKASVFQTLALISLDAKPLKESSSMLLIQLTNLAGEGQSFLDKDFRVMNSWGELPLLMEKGEAEIELKLPARAKVEALTLGGAPNGEVRTKFENGRLSFKLDNAAKAGGTMAYHLSR